MISEFGQSDTRYVKNHQMKENGPFEKICEII